jgi:hypothetical protein
MHTPNKLKPSKVPQRKEEYPIGREKQELTAGRTTDISTMVQVVRTWVLKQTVKNLILEENWFDRKNSHLYFTNFLIKNNHY